VGFDSERNAVTIITADEVSEAEGTKLEVAQKVLDAVVKIREHRRTGAPAKR